MRITISSSYTLIPYTILFSISSSRLSIFSYLSAWALLDTPVATKVFANSNERAEKPLIRLLGPIVLDVEETYLRPVVAFFMRELSSLWGERSGPVATSPMLAS